ncbi:MAG: SulP family inorganic anion transporter [Cyclobacteriaceae bacterium]|nr:SulP family inorganic anion transporter [Cyclobacteriaceae bacterium]
MSSFFKEIKSDLPASIVVFLVAVPLCLGIALASGAPMFSGIIAGIVGGIVVSIFSGSSLGVSGPAAGLAVIVLAGINDLGFEAFLLAVVIAGVIQVILGFAKAGIVGYYFPSSVIKGMLTAIGIIIILKQIPHAFGYDADFEGDLSFVQPDGENTFSELVNMFNYISPGAIIMTAIGLAIMIIWERPFMKKHKIFQLIQGPLVAVVSGIVLNLSFKNFPSLHLSNEQLVNIPIASDLTEFMGLFASPDYSQIFSPDIYILALTLAVVASLETLLSVEATDKLDPIKRVTPTNRELKAQGIGNIISGLIGGLPITQVIVRSSANIQSGGKTKASSFLHGVLLLASAILIPRILNFIPLASLAAILIIVGFKLAKPSLFKSMYRLGWPLFAPFMITIVAIVFTDLLIGIALGMGAAVMFILYTNLKTPYYFDPEKHHSDEKIKIELSENVSFLNRASILQTLNHLPENSTVEIDASKSRIIDHDVLELIYDFQENARHRNIILEFKGFNGTKLPDQFRNFARSMVEKSPGRMAKLR